MFPRSIEIGPFTLHFYGLIIAIAVSFGWFFAKKRARLYKIPESTFDGTLWLLPVVLAIVGARLYHVIDYWSAYKEDLSSILLINQGGLGIIGAIVGGIIGLYFISRIKKLNFLSCLDLLSPSMLAGQAFGRFANFVNQEGFGPPTDRPWGVFIAQENRPEAYLNSTHFHPTFFYEAAIDAIFFLALLNVSKKLKKPGNTFALYLVLYSLGRFIVEFFRIDTATIGSLKVAHAITAAMFITGVALLIKGFKTKIKTKIKKRKLRTKRKSKG